jgi:hypothetical protein
MLFYENKQQKNSKNYQFEDDSESISRAFCSNIPQFIKKYLLLFWVWNVYINCSVSTIQICMSPSMYRKSSSYSNTNPFSYKKIQNYLKNKKKMRMDNLLIIIKNCNAINGAAIEIAGLSVFPLNRIEKITVKNNTGNSQKHQYIPASFMFTLTNLYFSTIFFTRKLPVMKFYVQKFYPRKEKTETRGNP